MQFANLKTVSKVLKYNYKTVGGEQNGRTSVKEYL